MCIASDHCLRLLMHFVRRDASRADCTAGSKRATRTPMMAMTTSSSTSVKPRRREFIGRYRQAGIVRQESLIVVLAEWRCQLKAIVQSNLTAPARMGYSAATLRGLLRWPQSGELLAV